MNSMQRAHYLSFVTRSFRDVADRDYIAARILYRYNLGPQFLWSAMQAVEKYLKGILLYNDKSTISLGHDLVKARHSLSTIRDVPIRLPNDVNNFISYLNNQGNNRYLEKPAYTIGEELLMLDRTVWHVRKYCEWLKGQSSPGPDGKRINLFPLNLKRLRSLDENQANSFRIFGGVLEKVLEKRDSELRKYLVWKNFYYGKYKKKYIKHFKAYSWSENPSHYLHPEIFPILAQRVKFPKEVLAFFKKQEAESKNSV
jgi:HEPN domain-containing protein